MKCPFEECTFNRWDSLQSGIGEHFYNKHEIDCCKKLGELIENIEARKKELKKYLKDEPKAIGAKETTVTFGDKQFLGGCDHCGRLPGWDNNSGFGVGTSTNCNILWLCNPCSIKYKHHQDKRNKE